MLLLEKNCHFDPLKQKLGRLKHKCIDMGKLMDVLTRYGDSNTTKDPSFDDDKSGKGKKNGGSKGQQQHASAQHDSQNNQGNGGKCKYSDGGSDFLANTNAGSKNQHRNGNGRPSQSLEEMLNGPCPKHSYPNKPSRHAWKDCYIMRELKN